MMGLEKSGQYLDPARIRIPRQLCVEIKLFAVPHKRLGTLGNFANERAPFGTADVRQRKNFLFVRLND